MNLLIDEYRSNWALRSLREARSDLAMAENVSDSSVRADLICLVLKKLQTAIYYTLGDPTYLAPLVNQAIEQKTLVQDPILRFLLQVEWLIQIHKVTGPDNPTVASLKASRLLHYVTQLIHEITGIEA